MSACEKCWADAYQPYGDQSENYRRLLKERENHPCSTKDQAGQWWDEENQIDIRKYKAVEPKVFRANADK